MTSRSPLLLVRRCDVSPDLLVLICFLSVVPLSVMSNWETQIEDHVVPGVLSYCFYYGSGRNMSAEELSRHDIVITTYQTVAGEHSDAPAKMEEDGPSKKKKKIERSLFQVKWKVNDILFIALPLRVTHFPQRIILDEGHNIRNPKTKMAQAVCGLEAERRWVLSGTPIVSEHLDGRKQS